MNTFKLLKNLEYLFLLLTIVCVGYIGYFFLFQNKTISYPVSLPSLESSNIGIQEDLSQEIKPYDFYARQIDARDVFVPVKVKVVDNTKVQGQLPVNLKVVGIVLGSPVQVIIEDQIAKMTYFVTEHMPENGISIKRVTGDKIVLNYKNQDIEINVKGNQINAS